MEILEAIRSRRSIRSFKPDPVPREVLDELLETCQWAPSSQNTQSWEVVILGDKIMKEVKTHLIEKIKAEAKPEPDIPVPNLPELYLKRATKHRDIVDTSQFPPGTDKLDEKRAEYWIKGGCFHNAPNGIILCMERTLFPKMLLDAGIMAQTICLAATAYGLGTCITLRPVYWPDMLRELIEIDKSKLLVMGIAIGYPETEARINNFVRQREPIQSFVYWRA